jgi:hypothetical protein
MMKQIGNNLIEKRRRSRRSFRNARNKECILCCGGCSLELWNLIFESLSYADLQTEMEKYKVATNAITERLKFMLMLESCVVGRLNSKFVSTFGHIILHLTPFYNCAHNPIQSINIIISIFAFPIW